MTPTPKRLADAYLTGAVTPDATARAPADDTTHRPTGRNDASKQEGTYADGDHGALVRFLEDRFACALACTDCARACALRVSFVELEPLGPPPDPGVTLSPEEQLRSRRRAELRRRALLCVEVCDATCRLLSEETRRDEYTIRLQVEWCRAVALECAHACDRTPDSEACGEACRACARTCTDFLATLSG